MKQLLDMWRAAWGGMRRGLAAVWPRRWMGWVGLAAACCAGAVVIGLAVVWWIGRAGNSSAVEKWVGQQLQGVAQGYLKPRLTIGGLKYIWPKTVVLRDVRLTAESQPAGGAKETMDIAVVKKLTLELGEVPREGKPIVIEQLILEEPELRLVAISATDGRLVGFSDLLAGSSTPSTAPAAASSPATGGRGNSQAATEAHATAVASNTSTKAATNPAADGGKPALSSVFAIELLEIKEGSLEYDARRPGEKAMTLSHLNTALHVKASMDGWYGMDFGIALAPVFDLKIKGQWNIDTMLAKVDALELGMRAGRESDHNLPPALQEILKDHEAQGELAINAGGTIPLMDVLGGDVHATVTLAHGHLVGGSRQVTVEKMTCGVALHNRQAEVQSFALDGSGGHVKGTASVSWAPRGLTNVQISLDGARLQETVRDPNDKRVGVVNGNVHLTGPTDAIAAQATGGGEIHIRQGRLVDVPVVKQIKDAMKIMRLASDNANDTADVFFDFKGDRAHVSKLAISTDVLAAHGEGDILFNGNLNLDINGGPLEKVQEKLGVVGQALGAVTDQMAHYQVRGTLSDPKVNMAVGPRL